MVQLRVERLVAEVAVAVLTAPVLTSQLTAVAVVPEGLVALVAEAGVEALALLEALELALVETEVILLYKGQAKGIALLVGVL